MNKRLLTLDDLCEYYSHRKKSMKFSSEESGEPIVVQVAGTLKFEDSNNLTAGLTPVRLQACHTEKNLNKSSISYETMHDKLLPTFKNRPILGYIHDVDGVPQFYGHNAHEEDGEIVYDEIAVGNIPETNNAELVYDEENDRYNVIIDGYLYDEYTKATEIVKREEECPCSVEISIKSMSFDAKDHTLVIEDGYFSGVAILGYDDNGNKVQPGMAGSNVKLKDFSMSNNSILNELSNDEHSKLIETLDNLNKTLSSLNINSKTNPIIEKFEKGGNTETNMTKFNELLKKYNKTVEDITFEYEGLSDEELEEVFSATFDEPESTADPVSTQSDNSDKPDDDNGDNTGDSSDDDSTEEPDNSDEKTDDTDNTDTSDDDKDKDTYSKTFELSHEDVRSALYQLLAPIEETLNEYYWIMSVYDDYFIYESCCGNYYKQAYTKENDVIAFNGERQEVFAEFVTADEKAELENMRANYSSISEKLAKYEEAEEIADKMTVFDDQAYSKYLETDEFKKLMDVENVKKFTKDELVEKADAALGKVVKTTKTFSMDTEETHKETKPSFFAFAKTEKESSFLDGLLKK